ncbi:hypothetical protein HPP92_000049 [Vanilla planifolia]|uniref:RNA 3'-terminal phosphate cyclase insert domain-containing protein n=1 Tax=Vanilla planifolia TaxID=51239 RepID=A0A835RTR6_VANPL|nr:hypothetical protein HPP92_000050 [Vanilla planifolia]KAG0499977.1 hypothetical protein HPP92_000049 [Vanilla planifolia]
MVKRIKGVTFSTKVSPQFGNHMVSAARGVFNLFILDVHIFIEHKSGQYGGRSPGYGISLVVERTTGCLISADRACCYPITEHGTFDDFEEKAELLPPEDVGVHAAWMLLGEIENGGVVDSSHTRFFCFFFALYAHLMCLRFVWES